MAERGPVEVMPTTPSSPASDLPAVCHSLMERSPVPMAELEGAGHVVRYANPAFCRLAEKSTEALVGKPFAEAMQEGDTCLAALDRVYRTGEAETHTESEHPGPSPAYWSYTMWPVLDDKERSVGVMMQVTETTLFHQQAGAMNEALLISSVQQHEQTERAETLNDQLRAEIVERTRVEEALSDSEERYRSLVAQVADYAIFSTDIGGRATTWNEGVKRILGFDEEEFIGRDIAPTIFTPEDFRAGVPDRELRTAAAEGSASDDRWLRRRDGTRFFAQGTTTALRDSSGRVVGFSKIFRDTTDHQLAEVALRESESNLEAELAATRQLQEISSALIHEGDTEALYRKIVDAAATIMGSDAASMQMLHPGRSELRLIASKGFHPESAGYWEWVLLDSASTCGVALNSGKRVMVPDVEACEFMAGTRDLDECRRSGVRAVQSTPLVSRAGRLLGMISTHWRVPHDPTESDVQRLDLLARQAADLIERKEAELRQQLLINELNHRVKNMLATVQAIAAQTLRGSKIDPNAREAFEARLIALSSAHSILTQESWEGAEIHDIVARVLDPHADSERLRVQGPLIRLSPKAALAIAMGLHELASNAVKYGSLSNGTGQVAVTWAVDGPRPGTLHLQWSESGGPAVKPPSRKGFGSRLIERNLAYDLNGQAKIEYRAEGVLCTVTSVLESAGG